MRCTYRKSNISENSTGEMWTESSRVSQIPWGTKLSLFPPAFWEQQPVVFNAMQKERTEVTITLSESQQHDAHQVATTLFNEEAPSSF